MTIEMILPSRAFALTTGPSQPEVQAFEPVSTTDMVDLFSGDFVYNIPLMDVEGYPINISYHGGVSMEQEASWVGLGWNINPGVVNRNVRGLPDDFNGETIQNELHIKSDITTSVGPRADYEFVGKDRGKNKEGKDTAATKKGKESLGFGCTMYFNNYKGVSAKFSLDASLRTKYIQGGINLEFGGQSGFDLNYNIAASSSIINSVSENNVNNTTSVGLSANHGFNSRSGFKDFSLSPNISNRTTYKNSKHKVDNIAPSWSTGLTQNSIIPISMQNYVPVVANSTNVSSLSGRLKYGYEAKFNFLYFSLNGNYTCVDFLNDGNKSAYGYGYLQNSSDLSMLDFSRDRDGLYNKSMKYLPMSQLTYDIYGLSGQGTGGMFRMFRNDFGEIHDPEISTNNRSHSFMVEFANLPDILELGLGYTIDRIYSNSGPGEGFNRGFSNTEKGNVRENVFLKQGGELTSINNDFYNSIGRNNNIEVADGFKLVTESVTPFKKRMPRGNLIYQRTASAYMDTSNTAESKITYFDSSDGFSTGPHPTVTRISKKDGNEGRSSNQFSEIVQVQKDGRQYVYGIAAMNRLQKEATFSVNPTNGGNFATNGLIDYTPGTDDNHSNGKGSSNFYNSSITPSYAHSYLLTSVLSNDYVDITGDGISDDDLGTYTKLNYTLKEKDYRWKAPYDYAKAQHSPGNRSDPEDDKGSYSSGSREQWYVHSIESRNYVAEFYTSERDDACGMSEPIITHGLYATAPYNHSVPKAKSYKLDSIRLFNKHDRFINVTNAVPIKTVYFVYDYSLCKGIPNNLSGDTSKGKLTLRKLYFKYGNSEKSLISPYKFNYGFNPNYSYGAKDRWGSFKPVESLDNFDFPFVNQTDTNLDLYTSAWCLNQIHLPSGGDINVEYESDDYAYVQDSTAEEMFMIKGVGVSPNYVKANKLYQDEKTIHRYLYFKRRVGQELNSEIISNYCKPGKLIYFNCDLGMVDNKRERFKGYFEAKGAGVCPNDPNYGYILLDVMDIEGGGFFKINPITLAAINEARYSMPQLIYKRAAPTASFGQALVNALSAFGEITSLFRNPIVKMLKKNIAKEVNLERSYIRLNSPDLCKKGGGHRVKTLKFVDNWTTLAGGNEQPFTYGKRYVYHEKNGASTGVASYEPLLGGDEIPMRLPIPYRNSRGYKWPPVDAIYLYQQGPIGETFYPPGSVGYNKVYEINLNKEVGKSAQALNIYEYYTAKDFPISLSTTELDFDKQNTNILFLKKRNIDVKQSFTLNLNDMHGKPKSIKKGLYTKNDGDLFGPIKLVNSVFYNYFSSGNRLNNDVKCLVYDSDHSSIMEENRVLGVDVDVAIDKRFKSESQYTRNIELNLNISNIMLTPIPIPTGFLIANTVINNFKSATVSKVVQQYGILEKVTTKIDNAVIVEKNEYFDPETGDVLITSVNNEFDKAKEYKVSVPAYWSYDGMGPAYTTINYEENIPYIAIDSHYRGRFYNSHNNFAIGDELRLRDSLGHLITAWYLGNNMDTLRDQAFTCNGYILPRFPRSTSGWNRGDTLWEIDVKVMKSGRKNLLQVPAETFTTLNSPIVSGQLATHQTSLINLQANTYCDSNTALFFKYIISADTINPYVTGERGIYRLLSNYSYVDKRNRDVNSRLNGLFEADRMYIDNPVGYSNCDAFPYKYFAPRVSDPKWVRTNYISKYSPYGAEVENVNAINNYSTAQYGYNEDLPTAIGKNMRQGDLFFDGFEDYGQLHFISDIMDFKYSFIKTVFGFDGIPYTSTKYNRYDVYSGNGVKITNVAAHTGLNSLYHPVSSSDVFSINIPVNQRNYSLYSAYYNSYFRSNPIPYNAQKEYLPFMFNHGKKYYCSFWINNKHGVVNPKTYSLATTCGVNIGGTVYQFKPKTNIIDGWQQFEVEFEVPSGATTASLDLPNDVYIDDIRMFPKNGSVKSFAYNPINQKLMATLDENNIATFYEYDQEGNLIRTKKETERGIMTINESRSSKTKY